MEGVRETAEFWLRKEKGREMEGPMVAKRIQNYKSMCLVDTY